MARAPRRLVTRTVNLASVHEHWLCWLPLSPVILKQAVRSNAIGPSRTKRAQTSNKIMSTSDKDGGATPPSVQGEVVVDAAVEDDEPADKSVEEGTTHPEKKRRRQDDDPEAPDNSNELNDEGEKRPDPSKRVKVSEPSADADLADKVGTLAPDNLAAAASSETPASLNDGKETTTLFGSSAKSAVSFGSLSGATPGFGSLASNGTTFGAGFGSSTGFGAASGFGDASSGFGAASSASSDNADGVVKPKTFGSGFGSSSAGFGSVASAASTGSSGFAGTFAQQKPKEDETPKIFEEDVDTNNGEENETCILQVRAKLYKMVWVQEKRADEGISADKTPSVPSIKGRLGELNKAKADGDNKNDAGNGDKGLQPKGKLVQKEAGGCKLRFCASSLISYLNSHVFHQYLHSQD